MEEQFIIGESRETRGLPSFPTIRVNHVLYGCVGILIFVQMIMMCILIGSVSVIAPEVKSVLSDAQQMVPEMHKSLVALGRMLPEIRDGMKILDQLCRDNSNCHI